MAKTVKLNWKRKCKERIVYRQGQDKLIIFETGEKVTFESINDDGYVTIVNSNKEKVEVIAESAFKRFIK